MTDVIRPRASSRRSVATERRPQRSGALTCVPSARSAVLFESSHVLDAITGRIVSPPSPLRQTADTTEGAGGLFDLMAPVQLVRAGTAGGGTVALTAGPSWTPDLARRVRALLHATPLTGLRDRRLDGLQHYDLLALAVALLDAILDRMGLGDDLDHAGAVAALVPLARAMDRLADAPDDADRQQQVAERVLGMLLNEEDRREPFECVYPDVADGGALTERHFKFRLVREYTAPIPGGERIVLRLTDEAINLLLKSLSHDLADEHAAAEGVVQSQLARGRFADALQTARMARIQSIRYNTLIAEQVERTKRDIRLVDWQRDMPAQLADARRHIELRLTIEENILAAAREQLDALQPGSDAAQEVAGIIALIKDCRDRHHELHGRLMRAPEEFLDAQARQAFHPVRVLVHPDLTQQVVLPYLRAAEGAVLSIALPPMLAAAGPAIARGVFSLEAWVEWLLRPRREVTGLLHVVEDPALVVSASDPAYFPSAAHAVVLERLRVLDGPEALSALLDDAQLAGGAARAGVPLAVVQRLLALTVLRAYAPDAPQEHADDEAGRGAPGVVETRGVSTLSQPSGSATPRPASATASAAPGPATNDSAPNRSAMSASATSGSDPATAPRILVDRIPDATLETAGYRGDDFWVMPADASDRPEDAPDADKGRHEPTTTAAAVASRADVARTARPPVTSPLNTRTSPA